ncbi:MAG: DoxX family protein [Pseudomonadales bacterium]|jgi:uncharacterized membrane protein YphA (DoxX/SURF4 family)
MRAINLQHRLIELLEPADGLGPLLLRLYLAPVLTQAGWTKFAAFEQTASWFGNPDWGLGLPFPTVLTFLAAGAELIGGIALVAGLATRWFAVPLIVVMLVAIFAVHWPNGWPATADCSTWLASNHVMEACERKAAVISILKDHRNYGWLTDRGPVTILNNGVEFAVTYLVMLIVLLFTGGGRYTSLDYWVQQFVRRH